MQNQSKNLSHLKNSLEELVCQINQLLEIYKKDSTKVTTASLKTMATNIKTIESDSKQLQKETKNDELNMNLDLIQGFIHQEFFINKKNTLKTSLIALNTLESETDSLNRFKQMLSFWSKESKITQVLIDDLYNIIDELAI